MNINWNTLENATSIEKALKYWAIEFIIRKSAMETIGDRSCAYDIYTHAYEYVYNKMSELVNSHNIVEYLDESDKDFTEEDALYEIATAVSISDDIEVNHGVRIQNLISKWKTIFMEFEGLIATLSYHTHKFHTDFESQRDFHSSQLVFVWLKLKKFNRDHQLLMDFTDDELRGTVLAWFKDCRLSKTPDLYEQFDVRVSDSMMVENLIAELDGSNIID